MSDIKKRVEETLSILQHYEDNTTNRSFGGAMHDTSKLIKALTEREASLMGDIERLERKKNDYPNVLAKMFNDLTTLQADAIRKQKIFSDALLEINNLSRCGKLTDDTLNDITVATLKEIELNNKGE